MVFWENFLGGVASITTIIGMVPQVYKSFKTRSTGDVSMIMLLNYLVCSVSWAVYGLFYMRGDRYVVLSNGFGTVVACISIWQKHHYDNSHTK
ncbi:MAG: hypothetical protein LBL32_03610 [Holosporales bacterium]|jgi:MtN3 and saliva related transmembrane protein|nr:hypothetical protein [Holosporales bacterium]